MNCPISTTNYRIGITIDNLPQNNENLENNNIENPNETQLYQTNNISVLPITNITNIVNPNENIVQGLPASNINPMNIEYVFYILLIIRLYQMIIKMKNIEWLKQVILFKLYYFIYLKLLIIVFTFIFSLLFNIWCLMLLFVSLPYLILLLCIIFRKPKYLEYVTEYKVFSLYNIISISFFLIKK